MASKVDKVVKKMGKAFDKMRKKLLTDGWKYFLLAESGATNKFTVLLEIDKTYHNYSDFREAMHVKTGRLDSTFITAFNGAGAIAMGSDPFFIYDIEARDKMEPTVEKPFYHLYAVRTGKIFTPPEPEP